MGFPPDKVKGFGAQHGSGGDRAAERPLRPSPRGALPGRGDLPTRPLENRAGAGGGSGSK